MHTPHTPGPSNRPSSVARRATPTPTPSSPPPADGDATPTVISTNRPGAGAAALNGLEGKQLGHFEILGTVGVGGMAAVLRAHDLQLDRVVALKILPPEMAADPENITRFKQEARAAARLDHENIARVYFCGEDQGLHFIAFEFVDGEDLRTVLSRNGALSPATGVRYMLQLAAGLAHAAQRGVVHRDIKPSNILITPAGQAKIVDMGLARSTGSACGALTQSGMTLGTFDYISPEQALEPREADVRSDIYSLGCTFYHALTGQPPVPEGTAARKLHHQQHVEPTDPRELNPAIPDELAAVLARMMAKDPAQRYQSADELIQHLLHVAQILNVPPDPGLKNLPPPVSPLPAPLRHSALLVGLAGVAAVLLLAIVIGLAGPTGSPPRGGGRPTGVPAPDAPVAVAVAPPVVADTPAPAGQPKRAATVAELAQLLADPQTERIILTGTEYAINDLFNDAAKAGPPGLTALVGRKLVIEGEPGRRPVIRLTADSSRAAQDPDQVQDNEKAGAALTLAGTTRESAVEFHNVRFVVDAAECDGPHYAVVATGLAKLTAVGCEFDHSKGKDGGGAIRFEGRTVGGPAVADLSECLFARGAVAVDVVDRAAVKARQCAFGPHDILVRFKNRAVPLATGDFRSLAEFTHCTALMGDGTVFQLEKNVSATLRAGHCVFARATDEPGETVLVRQTDRRGEVEFSGPASRVSWRNAYYGMTIWADPERTAASLADCRAAKVPFKDANAVELTRAPWVTPEPLTKMADPSKDAFALNTASALLRTPADVTAMLGVQRGPQGDVYSDRFPLPTEDLTDPAAGTLVVDPAHPDEAKRTFRTLAAAVEAANTGDTILIAAKTLDVHPIVLAEPKQLTIQAANGLRPVVRLHPAVVAAHTELLKVYDGGVTFKNLHFQLKPGDKAKTRAVVTVIGAGKCTFQNCTATLDENPGGVQRVALAAVDYDKNSADGVPEIRIEQTFVRGKGDVVVARENRPFKLDVENSLAALDGSMVTFAQPKEPAAMEQAVMTFKKVTAYLNDAFMEIRAAEGDRKGVGLTAAQVACENCLFVAAADSKPFVHAVGVDGETLKLALTWKGDGTVYGNYGKMLHVELPGQMTAVMPMMPSDWTTKNWRDLTHEPDDVFPRLTLPKAPAGDRPFTAAQPLDFTSRFTDMKRGDAPKCGAELKDLPVIDEE